MAGVIRLSHSDGDRPDWRARDAGEKTARFGSGQREGGARQRTHLVGTSRLEGVALSAAGLERVQIRSRRRRVSYYCVGQRRRQVVGKVASTEPSAGPPAGERKHQPPPIGRAGQQTYLEETSSLSSVSGGERHC